MSTTKNALITGASRGLGKALAEQLARRGWQLIIDARGEEALRAVAEELSAHTEVVAIPGDVTDPDHRRELAEAAERLGGIDGLVNNASYLGPSPQPPLRDYPVDVLREVYETNVIASVALIQRLQPMFRDEPRVVNVTSDAAVEAYPGWGGYGSSKAALEQATAILAAEHPDWGVYAVDPGDMRTEMHRAALPERDLSEVCPPFVSAPGIIALLEGDYESGRYLARRADNHHDAGLSRHLPGDTTAQSLDTDIQTGGIR